MTIARYSDYAGSGVDWLGALPAHWTVKPIKAVSSLNDEVLSEATSPDSEIEYVEISDVAAGRGIIGSTALLFEAAPSRARRRVTDGDIIVSTVRTYLRAIASVERPPDNMVVSTGFAVIRPRTIHPPFLAYALEMDGFINQVIARSVGVSYPAINASELVCLPVPVPPRHEQAAIAAFLKRETRKIDALVATQRRLIDLLQEKRQAVISHAVTKGLDPDAPMKDSGVEWLGEVPAKWGIKRLKQLCRSIKAGPFGSALTKDMYCSDGFRVYGQEQVIPNDFSIGDYYIDEPTFQALRQYEVVEGDVLISCVGTFGKIARVPHGIEPGIINPRLLRLRPSATVTSEYLELALGSLIAFEQMSASSRGGTMDVINISTLGEIYIATPPITEQPAILAFVQAATRRFDDLRRQASAAMALLEERRAALISAAVTGQIDVRQRAIEPVAADQTTARRVVGATVLELVADSPSSGRMTSAKRMYLAETHAGVWELRGQPQRMAAGPFDGALMTEVEAQLARIGHIATSQLGGPNSPVEYRLIGTRGALRTELDALLGDRSAAFDKMLADLGGLESKGVEAVATLYAVWNDMLIDGQTPTDDALINGVLNDWHAEKRDKFTRPDLVNYLGWMRRHDLTPSGRGPRTKSGALL